MIFKNKQVFSCQQKIKNYNDDYDFIIYNDRSY